MGETIVRIITALLQIRTDPNSQRRASESIDQFARGAIRSLRSISEVAAVIAFDKIIQGLVNVSSRAEDVDFVFRNMYGSLADDQEKWAKQFADTYNRSATRVKESLSQIQHEMVGFTKAGTDAQKKNVAEMSKTIEEAALNLGAFYGIDSKTAVKTLISATQGSEAAMQTFNVGQGQTITARRQEAMKELRNEGQIDYWTRSYENLSLYEKSLVNLRTVLIANKDSMDALARSQLTYSVMHENFVESLEELREVVGTFILPTAKIIVDYLTKIIRFLKDVADRIKIVTDFLGITGTVLQTLAIVLTALAAIRIIQRLLPLVRLIMQANPMVLLIATTIGLVILAIRSFTSEATGARKVLQVLVGVIALVVAAFVGYRAVLLLVQASTIAYHAVIIAMSVALGIARVATAAWAVVQGILNAVMAAFPGMWVVAIIAAIIAAIYLLVKGIIWLVNNWDTAVAAIMSALQAVGNFFRTVFTAIRNAAKSAIDWIKEHAVDIGLAFLGPIGWIVLLIKHFDKLKQAASNAWNWIKRIFGGGAELKESGKDMVTLMADGIEEETGRVREKAEGVAEAVDETLGFSLPEKGPLAHFDKSMPDMVDLMALGLEKGRTKLSDAAKGLAAVVSSAFGVLQMPMFGGMLSFGRATGSTVAMAGGRFGIQNFTQNVTFNQEFNGPESMEQKVSRAAEDSADDIVGAVARLIYES